MKKLSEATEIVSEKILEIFLDNSLIICYYLPVLINEEMRVIGW